MFLRSDDIKSDSNFLEKLNENNFDIRHVPGKNRGIFNKEYIRKNEIVIEYIGEVISDVKEMKSRERTYIEQSLGCYVVEFEFKGKKHFIDATEETKYKGRLLNHSCNPNLKPIIHVINETPRFFFVATKDIASNTELVWDYGERRKAVLLKNIWLTKKYSYKGKIKNRDDSLMKIRKEYRRRLITRCHLQLHSP